MTVADCSETFRHEAQDLLEQLEQTLLDLEQTPSDHELVDRAFRALHTIKGSGAMFGFDRVAGFTHGFETAFDRVRKGAAPPSRELVAVALAAKDHIRALIERPGEAADATGDAILRHLGAVVDAPASGTAAAQGGSAAEPAPKQAPEQTAEQAAEQAAERAATWRIRFRLPKDALINGTDPLRLLDELRGLGPCRVTALTDAVPPLDELEPDGCYLGWEVTLATAQPRASIEEVFLFVFDDAELSIEQTDAAQTDPGQPEPEATQADVLRPRAAEADPHPCAARHEVPAAAGHDSSGPRQAEPREADREIVKRQGEGRRETDKGSTLRVPAERLDELMDRVGELVIAQARLTQLAGSSADIHIKSVAEEIERLASGLRDTTMGIRMVPIGTLFGRFRRLVHDLARDLGKQVELIMEGEETELDKTMIERLADPLVHLIRNAIDHGLEAPEARIAAGKTAAGRVRLTARHSGAEVLVTIADDGRGLDRERIRAKAEEHGLIAADATLADSELYQLLFHAGFSTAREVSAVSGRGVGMDVVKRAIDALRGTIDIATKPGEGTDVTLRLPLTLAIIDGLLVRVGAGRYAIPLSAVEECVELAKDVDERSRHRSFMNIRGDLVPFLRLGELFSTRTPPDPFQKVVIVSAGDLRVGLVVDQIIGSHQTVIKSLSKLQADVEMFSGATILGDGTVALILDTAHLVDIGQAHEGRLRTSQAEAA